MTQFMSTVMAKIDAKGRVSVPSVFRAAIAAQNSQSNGGANGQAAGPHGIFLTPSFTEPAIEGGGEQFMATVNAMVERLDLFAEERDALAAALFADSHHLSFDADGRVSLPEALCAHAEIDKALCFVGLGSKFQIWSPDRFAAYRDRARALARDNRNLLRAYHADPSPPSKQGNQA